MDWLLSFDRDLFLLINSFNFVFLNHIMIFLSGQLIWVPVVLFFIIVSYQQFDKKKWAIFIIFLLLIIIASDVSSSYILKNTVKRMRPCKTEDLKLLISNFGQRCGGKYGFVSSHAANSMGLIIFSLGVLLNKKWFFFFWLMPLLVGYSRIYLGVHYPGDILGGFVIGTFWSLLMLKIFRHHYGARREINQ